MDSFLVILVALVIGFVIGACWWQWYLVGDLSAEEKGWLKSFYKAILEKRYSVTRSEDGEE